MLKIEEKKWSVTLFICKNLYGLTVKTLAACLRTRDFGLSPHGDVRKIDIVTKGWFEGSRLPMQYPLIITRRATNYRWLNHISNQLNQLFFLYFRLLGKRQAAVVRIWSQAIHKAGLLHPPLTSKVWLSKH